MKLFDRPSLFLGLALVIRAYSQLNVPNDVNLPSVRDDIVHRDLAPRDDTYNQVVERGRGFWTQFNSNQYSAPITGGDMDDLGFRGWKITSVPPSAPDPVLTNVLHRVGGRLTNQYHEWRAEYTLLGAAFYTNMYGPKDGVIVALDNVKEGPAIPMSNWSEVVWRIWADTCRSDSIDAKTLKYIIQHRIVNEQTLDIMDKIYDNDFPDTDYGDPIILLPSGRTLQAFQALLGSPNGRGVAWMLLNKRNVLGKTIAKITVEWVEGSEGHKKLAWEMWFELQDVARLEALSITSE